MEVTPLARGAYPLQRFVVMEGSASVVLQGLEAMLHVQVTTEGNTR
jgi:hypothetical protein